MTGRACWKRDKWPTYHRSPRLRPDPDLCEIMLTPESRRNAGAELTQKAARMPLPADLRQQVEQRFDAEPRLSWDAALAEVLGRRPWIIRPIR